MESRKIREVIELLQSNGITLFVKNNELKVKKRANNQLSEELLTILKSNKEALITFLKSQKKTLANRVRTASDYGLPQTIRNKKLKDFLDLKTHQDRISNIYPLTPLQKGFLFHNLYEENNEAYVCQFHCDLKGRFSRESFDKSWTYLMQKHTVLRTAIFGQDLDIPVQCVYDQVALPVRTLDFTEMEKKDLPLAFDIFLEEDKKTGFSFKEAPLFRITLIHMGEGHMRFVLTHHHIILDGWSVQNLMRNFYSCYLQLEKGFSLPKLTLDDFGKHLWHISKKNEEEGLSYWKTYLSKLSSPSYLPFVKDSALRNKVFGVKKLSFKINGALKEYTKKHRITENTLVQGAWSYLLSKYTGSKEVVFGATILGRDLKEEGIEGKAGLYINTVPVCDVIEGDMKVSDWLQKLQKEHTPGREEYGHLSLSDMEGQSTINGSLFDTMISFQKYQEVDENVSISNTSLNIENLTGNGETNYTCALDVHSNGDTLEIALQYNEDLIADTAILKIKRHLEVIIGSLLSDVEYVRELIYFTEEEHQLLNQFNATTVPYEKDRTVLDLFEEQVASNPKSEAIIYEGERLTYEELDLRSTQWAQHLVNSGVEEGAIIALRMGKSIEIITAIFAVLKTGATYMVIDPELPHSRALYMLKECSTTVIIATEKSKKPIEFESYTWIGTAALDRQVENRKTIELPHISSDGLAYILYTSGSTGRPKGCMISHANLYNYIFWANDFYFDKDTDGNWGLMSSMSFDFSITPIFVSLTRGKKLFICNEEKSTDQLLEECFNNMEIDTLMLTPSHVSILKNITLKKTNVKTLLCGGEEVKKSHVQIIKGIDENITFFDVYGPTETTVICTAVEISLEDDIITIGRPIYNTNLHILDSNKGVLPVGVAGEIYISGSGVSNGYINNPILTSEKFMSINGVRCYRTGDLGRWDSEGRIEYVGRIDDQVKIRGFRIELNEIETVLEAIEGIKEAVVIVREDRTDIKQLVGYFVPEDEVELDQVEIQRLAEEKLPEYMVPRAYVQLDVIPVTKRGKIDKKRLPLPENSAAYEAPISETEKTLVSIWEEVLNVEKVGVYDNFYELGGDSIKAIQLASRSKIADIHYHVKDILVYQTISEIVRHLKKADTVVQEKGFLQGEVALHPIQKLFFEMDYENVSHSNQSVLLKVSKDITEEILESALFDLAKHHDALRMHYHKDNLAGHPIQRYGSSFPKLRIEEIPTLYGISERCTKYQGDLNIYSGDLSRFVLFKTPDEDKENRLLIAIHHLVVDGISWRILTDDLMNLIENYLAGNKIELPVKGTSYRQWNEQLMTYASTDSLKKEYMYWKDVLSYYVPLPVDSEHALDITYGETKTVNASLPPYLTEMLVHEGHDKYGTEINDILISALSIALSNWIDAPRVVIAMEGHGREELFEGMDINRTIGWFTSVYPICLNLQDVEDISLLIADTKDMLREVPNKGIGYDVLRFGTDSEKIKSDLSVFYEDLTFNYLGSFDNGHSAEKHSIVSLAEESTGRNVGMKNRNPHKMIVDCSIIDGSLQLEWKYDSRRYQESTIQYLTKSYLTALENIVSHNNQSWGQEEFQEEDYSISMI